MKHLPFAQRKTVPDPQYLSGAERAGKRWPTSWGLDVSLRLFDSLDEQLYLDRRAFEPFRRARLASRTVYLGRLRKAESELLFVQPPHLGSYLVLPFWQ
ncbi:hypothetical protein [Photobacterium ganghwense]|uniref:hypothetical protein n=1 Tax=Photobacterium ganghwense TaxID=320778 RepID=UPI0039F10772